MLTTRLLSHDKACWCSDVCSSMSSLLFNESKFKRLVCVCLTERSRDLISETGGKEQSVIHREDDVHGRVSVTKDEERVLRRG